MAVIKFSHNWNNKLDNDVFSTIRRHTSEKQQYYNSLVGATCNVLLEGMYHCNATLLRVTAYNYSDVDRHILALDTGIYDVAEQDALFSQFGCKDRVLVLLFKKGEKQNDRNKE